MAAGTGVLQTGWRGLEKKKNTARKNIESFDSQIKTILLGLEDLMAGIVLTFGPNAPDHHEKCVANFQKIKGLPVSNQYNSPEICLTKYKRVNDGEEDFLISEKAQIWVLGTLIYKNICGKKALLEVIQDFRESEFKSLTDKLDGHFVIFIKRRDEIGFWIISDHAGIINIYKHKNEDNVILSTSSMSISRTFKVSPNLDGIAQFLRSASICDNQTIYNEIETLDAASIYYVEYTPRVKFSKLMTYWNSPCVIEEGMDLSTAVEKVSSSINSTLENFVDSKVVCDLTGGFDSRIIVSAMMASGKNPKDISTFVFGPEDSREVSLVKGYWEALGIQGMHLPLPNDWSERFSEYVEKSILLCDGEENAFNYAPILFAQEYKNIKFDYSLNGLAGELYRDFWWIQDFPYKRIKADINKLVNTRVLQYEYDNSIFSGEIKRTIKNINHFLYNKYSQTNSEEEIKKSFNTSQIDNIYFRQKIRRWAGRTISTSNQLIRTFAPLSSKKCLEAGMSVPPNLKIGGRLVRGVVEKNWPALAKLKMLDGTPCSNPSMSNFWEFFPMFSFLGKKALRKISQKSIKRTILIDPTLKYDQKKLFQDLISNKYKNISSFEKMFTSIYYNKNNFEKFIAKISEGDTTLFSQLGNILTLENRMSKDNIILKS